MNFINLLIQRILLSLVIVVSFAACSEDNGNNIATVDVTGVSVYPTKLALETGDKQKMKAEVLPENATNKTLTWSSDDNSVATVNEHTGEVTAIEEGWAVITAQTQNAKIGQCVVSVTYKKEWEWVESHTTKYLNSVFFVDNLIGYIVGSNGTLLKSIDGGSSWTILENEYKEYRFLSVYFVNAQTGYIGKNNGILKTTDGGNTWKKSSHNQFEDDDVYAIHFLDSQKGFAVGDRGPYPCIYKTTDGGNTWVEKFSDRAHFLLHSISFANSNIGFAVGFDTGGISNDARVLKTTDNGETWVKQDFGKIEADLYSVYFVDEQVGFILGSGYAEGSKKKKAVVFKTTDGGSTWSKTYIETVEGLKCIKFIDRKVGYIAGDGQVYKTIDGGNTWEKKWIDVCSFFSICFTSPNNGIVVGSSGKIFKTIP